MTHRTVLALAGLAALAHAGCKSCAKAPETPEPAAATPAEAPAQAPTEAAVDAPRSRGASRDEITITRTAAAVLAGDRVYMWTDGRNTGVGIPADRVRWTPSGFEYQSMHGVRVLAPGGSFYWKPVASPDAKPLVFDGLAEPPDGWKINSNLGRGGQYELTITGPEGRRVRLGRAAEPPRASLWLTATAPQIGKASPPLGADAGWRRNDEGHFLTAPPEGATLVPPKQPDDTRLADWKADIEKLRDGPVKIELQQLVDFDGDGAEDGFLCVVGGKDDADCYVVRETASERQYFLVNFKLRGELPVLFTRDGGTYAALSQKVGRDGRLLRVARYDGHVVVTETIR